MSQRNEGMDLDFGAQFGIGIFSKLTNYIMVKQKLIIKLQVHGRARREAARRRKSECKINLSPR